MYILISRLNIPRKRNRENDPDRKSGKSKGNNNYPEHNMNEKKKKKI